MSNEKKKDNVIGIGHNRNSYSNEQYAKLLKSLRHANLYANQEMNRVRRLFDEAFTKRLNSNPNLDKLKDFEVHERRHDANEIARKFSEYAEGKVEAIDKKAKADELDIGNEEDHNE